MHVIVRSVYTNRLVVLTTVVVAVVASLLVGRFVKPLYEARASFYVPVAQDVFSLVTETGGGARAVPAPTVVRDQLRGYFGILTSGRVAARVAEVVPGRNVGQIQRGTRFQLTTAGMFLITATDRDPQIAAEIANAYADSFNDLFEEISLPRAAKTRRFIEEQLEKVRAELRAAEARLEEFKRANKTVSLAEEITELVKHVAALREQYELSGVSLEEVRSRIGVAEKRLASEGRMQLSSTMLTANPVIQQLETKLGDLEVDLAGLRAKYTELHPDVLKMKRQAAEARRRLQDEVERIVSSETHSLNLVHEALRQTVSALYADERATLAKQSGLRERLRELERTLDLLPDQQRRFGELIREVRHLEETDRMLALKLEDARIQEKREIQTFLVVDRAVAAQGASYPNLLLSVPAAGVMGLAAGLFYAIFLGFLKGVGGATLRQLSDAESTPE